MQQHRATSPPHVHVHRRRRARRGRAAVQLLVCEIANRSLLHGMFSTPITGGLGAPRSQRNTAFSAQTYGRAQRTADPGQPDGQRRHASDSGATTTQGGTAARIPTTRRAERRTSERSPPPGAVRNGVPDERFRPSVARYRRHPRHGPAVDRYTYAEPPGAPCSCWRSPRYWSDCY
jgi:hypothetical protein